MKTLLTLLISLNLHAQSQVLDYATESIGMKVGDGNCFALVKAAWRQSDRRYRKHLCYVHVPAAGDAVLMETCRYANGSWLTDSTLSGHIGIVSAITDSSLTIIEQGTGESGVVESVYRLRDFSCEAFVFIRLVDERPRENRVVIKRKGIRVDF